jgi:hypothetical protein
LSRGRMYIHPYVFPGAAGTFHAVYLSCSVPVPSDRIASAVAWCWCWPTRDADATFYLLVAHLLYFASVVTVHVYMHVCESACA